MTSSIEDFVFGGTPMKCRAIVCLALISLVTVAWVPQGICQRMFLDANADGECTASDRLALKGASSVDIWVETNYRGSLGAAATMGIADGLLTINSYEFILHAEGGRIQWGKFTNLQPTMTSQLGPFSNESDYYVGQLGLDRQPAGKYKLGSLEITVVSGTPNVTFATTSPVWQGASTSFGSLYAGREEANTLRYAPAIPSGNEDAEIATGDWSDAVGLDAGPRTSAMADAIALQGAPRFSAQVRQNASGGRIQFVVTTTRPGSLRIQLFDVSGRLAQVIADEKSIEYGNHTYLIDGGSSTGRRLPVGIYYFRLEAPEGIRTGKVAIVR